MQLDFGDIIRFKEAPREGIRTDQAYIVAEVDYSLKPIRDLVHLTNGGFFGRGWFNTDTTGLEINTEILEQDTMPLPSVDKKLDNLVANFTIPGDELTVNDNVAHLERGCRVSPSRINYDASNVTFVVDEQYLGHGWFAGTEQLCDRIQNVYNKLETGEKLHPKEIQLLGRILNNKYGAIKVKVSLDYDYKTENFWNFSTQVIGRTLDSENREAVGFKCVRKPSLIGEEDKCTIYTRLPNSYTADVVETQMDTDFLNPIHQYTWDRSERFKSEMRRSLHGQEDILGSDSFRSAERVQEYLQHSFPDVCILLRLDHSLEHYATLVSNNQTSK